MKLGVTATRHGMNQVQYAAAVAVVRSLEPSILAHGDCVGGDAQFATITPRSWFVVAHPCTLTHMRAFTPADEIKPVQTPFARNRTIVDTTDGTIAAPGTMQEEQHGGTWQTVRYARKKGKLLAIIWPDGTVEWTGQIKMRSFRPVPEEER